MAEKKQMTGKMSDVYKTPRAVKAARTGKAKLASCTHTNNAAAAVDER